LTPTEDSQLRRLLQARREESIQHALSAEYHHQQHQQATALERESIDDRMEHRIELSTRLGNVPPHLFQTITFRNFNYLHTLSNLYVECVVIKVISERKAIYSFTFRQNSQNPVVCDSAFVCIDLDTHRHLFYWQLPGIDSENVARFFGAGT
jgi:hypothetical protein